MNGWSVFFEENYNIIKSHYLKWNNTKVAEVQNKTICWNIIAPKMSYLSSKSSRRIAIALSGGVDSSVAAYLLQKNCASTDQLIGLFMNNWNPLDESTSTFCEQSERDSKDAQLICDALSIKLHKASFASEYWMDVFEPFVDEIERGRMLNPDIGCNSKIKFGAMKRYATEHLKATHIATGHYARLWNRNESMSLPECVEQGLLDDHGSNDWIETWGSTQRDQSLDPMLLAGADLAKDQSYFLSGVKGSAFRNVMFPLGFLSKQNTKQSSQPKSQSSLKNESSVREIASQANLPTAKKRESMGICFIGKRRFPQFISDYLANTPKAGKFICIDSQVVIGEHNGSGLVLTIGQGAKISGASQKWFVCSKDYSNGNVYICQGTHHPALYSRELFVNVKDWKWVGNVMPPPLLEGKTLRGYCRIRHLQPLVPCDVTW